MRDSLNASERLSRQKRLTLSEMPNLPTRKIEQVVRTSSRGSTVAPVQRNLVSNVIDRPRRVTHKRSRAVVQMGGTSSHFQRKDPSISPGPLRKRGRPTNEERLRRDKQDRARSSGSARGNSSGITRSLSSRSSNTGRRSSRRAGSPTTMCSGRSTSTAAIDPELFESIQHQGLQKRQTRKRPIDSDKLMKVIIGEERRECAIRATSNSVTRCRPTSSGHASAAPAAAAAATTATTTINTAVDDQKESMENQEAFSPTPVAFSRGRACPSPSRNGLLRTSNGSGRRFASRSVSTRARARGNATSPGRRGTAASSSSKAASVPQAPAPVPAAKGLATTAIGDAAPGEELGVSRPESKTVIVPSFRLHNLFGNIADENRGTSILQGGSGSIDAGAPGGNRDNTLSAIAPYRKQLVLKATDKPSVEQIARPEPHLLQGEVMVGVGGGCALGQGFVDLTKDAFVRSTHTVFGSDYDMDDEDGDFLDGLSGSEHGAVAEENWAISKDLFEAMIERLERQESRARDTQVLVEASDRLREDHHDAVARVCTLTQEADSVRFAADGSSAVGARAGDCDSSGIGHGEMNHDLKRRDKGFVYEDDTDSDEGECQARIMRGRGPVILSAEFALPLLRSYVAKHRERGRNGDTERTAVGVGVGVTRGKKGKVSNSEAAKSRCGNEADVSDSKLLAVFGYWARKRETYGGPMLRCFHAFMMKLWKRMDDPQREAEDLEEGRDPHASPEAFETLKSFRQDLDKARLVVDCVKRREKLKRSAIRQADSLWKIVDDTQDAPRISRSPFFPPSSSSSSGSGSASHLRPFLAAFEPPSTRRRTAAAAAAETLQDDEAFSGGSVEETHQRQRQQETVAARGARMRSKGGCAEQEHAWNALARLVNPEWHADDEHRGGVQGVGFGLTANGDVRAIGRVTRGQMKVRDARRREGEGAVSGRVGGGASGLFVLCRSSGDGSDGSAPAAIANGRELRSRGGGRNLPLGVAVVPVAASTPAIENGNGEVDEENPEAQDQQQQQQPIANTRKNKNPSGAGATSQPHGPVGGRSCRPNGEVEEESPKAQDQQQQQQPVVNTRKNKHPSGAGATSQPHGPVGGRSCRSDSAVTRRVAAKTAKESEPCAEQVPTASEGRRLRQQRRLPRVGTMAAHSPAPQPVAEAQENRRQSRRGRRQESKGVQQPTGDVEEGEEGNVIIDVSSGVGEYGLPKGSDGVHNEVSTRRTRGIGRRVTVTVAPSTSVSTSTSVVAVTPSPAAQEVRPASAAESLEQSISEERRMVTRGISRRRGSFASSPRPPPQSTPPQARRAPTGHGTKRRFIRKGNGVQARNAAEAGMGALIEIGLARETRAAKRAKNHAKTGRSSEQEPGEKRKHPVPVVATMKVDGSVSRYGRVRRSRTMDDAPRTLRLESSRRSDKADDVDMH